MAFHVGGRVPLVIEDGDYEGVVCEVDSINSRAVQYMVLVKGAALSAAEDTAASVVALRDLYDAFESLARPVWNVVDPAGPIPATRAGLLRAPEALVLALVNLWTDTLPPEPEPDPVDEIRADIERRAAAEAAVLEES